MRTRSAHQPGDSALPGPAYGSVCGLSQGAVRAWVNRFTEGSIFDTLRVGEPLPPLAV